MLQLIIISVYFVAMIIIGVLSRKKARGIDDFLLRREWGGYRNLFIIDKFFLLFAP